MIWLILGILLWSGAFWCRNILSGRLGGAGKGAVAVGMILGLVLMIVGFRAMDYIHVYAPPAWGVHLTNLLMLIAVGLVGTSHSKSRLRRHMRHPLLIGVIVWAVSHLLVNGDLASLILFGGMGLWAVISIILINWTVPYKPYTNGTRAGDIRLVLITLVAYALIAAIHAWLGVWPFPRG